MTFRDRHCFFRYAVIGFLFISLPPAAAFAANFTLTDREFISQGDQAFIGEVTNVQVLSSTSDVEAGTVTLHVIKALTGNLAAPSITFDYTRVLGIADNEENWDLIKPQFVSLKTAALGKKFLIFFYKEKGKYYVSDASNSVQDLAGDIDRPFPKESYLMEVLRYLLMER